MKIKVIHGSHGNKRYLSDFLSVRKTSLSTILLEQDPLFEDEVVLIRKKYGITKEWLTNQENNPNHGNLFSDNWSEEKTEKFFYECKDINSRLFLPYSWWYSISTFIAFNYFPTPEKIHLEIISKYTPKGKYLKWEQEGVRHLYNNDFVLVAIPEKISKKSLFNLIDQQWDEISARLVYAHEPPKFKILRPQLAMEIVKLRDEQKLKFSAISNILTEKYGDNDELVELVSSEDYIKNLYHRWKKVISRYAMLPF